jgi:hypothetical protein
MSRRTAREGGRPLPQSKHGERSELPALQLAFRDTFILAHTHAFPLEATLALAYQC